MINFLNAINFYTSLLVGFSPYTNFAVYNQDYIAKQLIQTGKVWRVELKAEISTPKEIFFIGGGVNVHSVRVSKYFNYMVLQDGYKFNTGLRVSIFELGYEHFCSHPVANPFNNRGNYYGVHWGRDEFYLKVEKGFKR